MDNFVKEGIFYRGYDEERDLPTIEYPIKKLVSLLNRIPNLVTFCSCGGHNPRAVKGFPDNREISAVIDFEVYDEKIAEKFFQKVLRANWVGRYPDSFIYIDKVYGNSYLSNLFDEEPVFEDELSWFYNMKIMGFGPNKRKARKFQVKKIKGLIELVHDEIKKHHPKYLIQGT